MRHLKYIASIALAVLLSSGCGKYMDEPGHNSGKVSVALEITPETPVFTTRAISENEIEDVNIFIYRSSTRVEHFYATGTSHKIDIAPGTYSFYVVANMHRDMGDLSLGTLERAIISAPTDGTLTMIGMDTFNIDGSMPVLSIPLKRHAAKIAYNIAVDPAAGDIEILSIQLCSIPQREYLITDVTGPTDPACEFYDSELRKFPEGCTNANGTFYMLSNRHGDVTSITSQDQKNSDKAPQYASYLRIRARSGVNKVVDYVIYLGNNMTTNFDVFPNEAHTYNITILSDKETDTRITSYTLDVSDSWPRNYNLPDNDYGELYINITNKGDYTFTGILNVTEGEKDGLAVGQGGWDYGSSFELWMPKNGSHRADLAYSSPLVKKGVSSQLKYHVIVTDNAGESTTFNFTCQFANMVQAYFPSGTGTVTVAGALEKSSTSTSVTGYCYEDGCTFTAAGGNGYAFDGWYADQAYTQLLSASASYKHAPTKVKTAIYARFSLIKQPKVEITCNEVNKNSTYMYNTNTVTMTVTDFSGPITIKASCKAGGLFTSSSSFTKTVTSGQRFTLDPLVFVPTATGTISYTIDVTTTSGITIASKTVTNTIVATKLTPTVRVYYGDKRMMKKYQLSGTTDQRYWYAFKLVSAQVAFSPSLDYPTPIGTRTLLDIEIYPKYKLYQISDDIEEATGHRYPYFQWLKLSDFTTTPNQFNTISVNYSDNLDRSDIYELKSGDDIRSNSGFTGMFMPYTQEDDHLILPSAAFQAIEANMCDWVFVEYSLASKITSKDVKLTNKISGIPLEIETSLDYIKFINDLYPM